MVRFDDAPGLVVRERRDGTFTAFWQCRSDLGKKGFVPKSVPLWRGTEPSEADRHFVSDQCKAIQAEMLLFGRGGIPSTASYDGSIRTLIACYKSDPDSPYRELRYRSRQTYDYMLKYIEQDHGAVRIVDLRVRDILRWHDQWKPRGVTMAHGLITQFRSLLSFGTSILECPDCAALKVKLSERRFEQARPRTAVLTAEMAEAVCAEAHRQGRPSIALAQAIQFEAMLRQKDIIGEWVPLNEKTPPTDVTHKGMKWVRGIRWEEIDVNLVLTHITSKRNKEIVVQLADAPMVMAELGKVGRQADGPVIREEKTGRPYGVTQFRRTWRQIATAAGVPKSVRNQDSRAGAITEATEAGAPMEHIKQAATHSQITTTERYARNPAGKSNNVLKMRVAHRTKTP